MLYEKEQLLLDKQKELIEFRQLVAQTIASQKRIEKQYHEAQKEVKEWQDDVDKAQQEGDIMLVSQALNRQEYYAKAALDLKAYLDEQTVQVETQKRQLIKFESEIIKLEIELEIEEEIRTIQKLRKKSKSSQVGKEEFRQIVAEAIASQKRIEEKYNEAQEDAKKWQRNAQLSFQKGDEALACQALHRKKFYDESVIKLKSNLDEITSLAELLKQVLMERESNL
ncbi:MAG: PspA/IM30 family protein [Nostoc sp. JL34]|uniref:PspA/IM30 family protein n=1 Tax=Nostoc sp. JL34 TaxID=2815397 RepID=UPI001D42422B|nr:PspA/IM30 family protein [Nostoc sp. JL34]MBN3884480.1 PspA/IM30 family protein [Nostoc sp. JL34]